VLNIKKNFDDKMKRRTTLLLISLLMIPPFFYFLPAVHGQDEDVTFIAGTLENYIEFDQLTGPGGATGWLSKWVYETLYWIENWDPDSSSFYIVPWLVESESVDASGLHVTLQLREGIEFSNGKPFNASVVKWNLDRQRDVGQSFYGEWGCGAYQAIIQWTWHSIEAFLAIPGNEVYNDSSLYPELWWNKDDSRYPPEYWDGTNQTALSNLVWPRDIGNWTGKSVWNPEPVWDVFTNTMKNLTGNFPSGELNSNVYDNVTLYDDDPYKITLNLFFPAWPFWKTTSLFVMSMFYPDGTWDAATQTFLPTGPMYYPGDKANANYKQKYMSVKGPAYYGLVEKADHDQLIGTGPYVLEQYDAADQWMSLTKNENYWGGNWQDTNRDGPIDVQQDEVIVQRYDTTEAMYTALLDGELDYAAMEGQWADYETQIKLKNETLTLTDQYPIGGMTDIRFNIWEVDKTLRYAMNFAFNKPHAADPNVEGAYVIPSKGPFWDALYTDYTTDELMPIMTHDGSGTENGFYFNLTEARWWLLHNDSWSYTDKEWPDGQFGEAKIPNGNKSADRATSRGLTDSSTDADWIAVAQSGDPIATISHLDHADYAHWYDNFKTYMALIGIEVVSYGPISAADYYPDELTARRWNPDGSAVKQSWRSTYLSTLPHLFNVVKWNLDDILGIGNVLDPADTFQIWNSWPYLPSKKTVTSDWAVSQGYTTYTPTTTNMRQLIHSWPFVSDDTQLMLDYGTVMDQVYKEANSIYLWKPTGFSTLSTTWTWAGRKPDTPYGRNIWDMELAGGPATAIIPGYATGIMIGISILTTVALAVTLKKRRM
jgi:ABC-type transport system substrate-binding protein